MSEPKPTYRAKVKPEAPATMTDAMGRAVPVAYVNTYDRTRDREVRQIHKAWLKARANLESLMADTLTRLDRICAARAADGTPIAARGNIQVSSFDGLVTVSCDVKYDIVLDDRVREARDLLLSYARSLAGRLGGEDGAALEAILDETFRSSADGRLSTNRVLSLLRMDRIQAPEWRRGLELLRQSIETRRGKAYVRVAARVDRQHDPVPIRLDVADCWPQPATTTILPPSPAAERGLSSPVVIS